MKWMRKAADPAEIRLLAAHLQSHPALRSTHVSATIARLLVLRGIKQAESAEHFLKPSLAHLHSPYRMLGMKSAIERIEAAIERKEGILIYGDYDVDGTAAIVLLKTAIELCGGSPEFHVPHRLKEGYDLRGDVIERAAARNIRLVISVDAGIRALAAAEEAHRAGVDLIVTDHHLPGNDGVPRALAILNPNQKGCDYPCKALCGAGVAFKVAQALLERRLRDRNQSALLTSFAKIAAIATIADAVPLTGENRVFTKLGLEALAVAVNPGLRALLDVAQVSGRPPRSAEVAFRIAPRMNAAGRMDVAADVVELFSTNNLERARQIAARLDRLNAERQGEEQRILEAIAVRFEKEPTLREAFCIVVDGEDWHRGVIGITATRIVERYGRPTLVVSKNAQEAHGSGRSIPQFHLLNALESCRELFSRYGGHAHAVGFSMPQAHLPELSRRIEEYARRSLTLADFEKVLELDGELSIDQVTPELYQALQLLEPFGVGNQGPVFAAHNLRLAGAPLIRDRQAKLKLAWNGERADAHQLGPRCHPDSRAENWRRAVTYSALAWNMSDRVAEAQLRAGDTLDVAFSLDHNPHPEFGGLELVLRDFKKTGELRALAHSPCGSPALADPRTASEN
ncbi:MAG TPA: single-stranded-DNA-specific exonuclease RecJ [Terriglobales bacterium]|nr:single-stranded-DNA-specific exonuclease RecJ [Terriglobales bacterium]